jgi:hypothetical protein
MHSFVDRVVVRVLISNLIRPQEIIEVHGREIERRCVSILKG